MPRYMPRAPAVFSCVMNLQRASMFEYAGCAWAWTRQAPRYVPCASATCILCPEFAECAYVSLCWLCMGMDEVCLSTCLVCSVCAMAIVVCVTNDGCLPKVVTYKEARRWCDMAQQSCVANSRQLSRSSTSKVCNGKHNFSHRIIFVCDDHANYL